MSCEYWFDMEKERVITKQREFSDACILGVEVEEKGHKVGRGDIMRFSLNLVNIVPYMGNEYDEQVQDISMDLAWEIIRMLAQGKIEFEVVDWYTSTLEHFLRLTCLMSYSGSTAILTSLMQKRKKQSLKGGDGSWLSGR